MIKVIKISALVASILLASGIFFKSQHFLGANALFITGVATGILYSGSYDQFLYRKALVWPGKIQYHLLLAGGCPNIAGLSFQGHALARCRNIDLDSRHWYCNKWNFIPCRWH